MSRRLTEQFHPFQDESNTVTHLTLSYLFILCPEGAQE
jgi:hypothetical protein